MGGHVHVILAGAILIASASVPPVPAKAQVKEIVGAVGTGLMIEQLADKLNGLIEQAEQAGDFLAKRAAQEASYVLEAFERANTSLLEKAFEEIGQERQAILNQINHTADDIENGRIDTLDRLEGTTDQIDRLVRETTFKQTPVIFRYRGSIVAPGETQDVRSIISGYRITQGAPHIIFRGQRYEARKDGENLRFELPRSLFVPEYGHIRSEDATLVLEGREGGVLGMGAKPVNVEYDINIVTLPQHVATIKITYEAEVSQMQERVVPISENHNSSSRDWNCRSFAYSPATADRSFDVERSYVRRGAGNRRGQLRNVSIRDVGISFQICAKRRRHDRDNGFRHAVGRYVEVWTTETKEPRTKLGVLKWTENTPIPVEDPIERLLVKVTDFARVVHTVTASGGRAGRYAAVRYDADSKVVIVDPVIPNHMGAL
jgi:hypothetical protein